VSGVLTVMSMIVRKRSREMVDMRNPGGSGLRSMLIASALALIVVAGHTACRNDTSAGGGALRTAAAPAASAAPVSESGPWNIVFILADDMGWNQTGYGWNRTAYPGEPFYETPHIDRLAAQGMTFTDAYAAAPICSPSRAALMTGKYPARLHITDYIPGNRFPYARLVTQPMVQRLPLEEITIPELLKAKGYVSGHFGKWHLNADYNYVPGRPFDPGSQGFDDVYTATKPTEKADPYSDPHRVEEITRRSIRFLEANKDKPFFLYVAHHVVHRPLHETPEHIAKYQAKWGSQLAEHHPVMGAMIERMDDGIGRILAKLDELRLTNRTLVVFTSDNGGLELLQSQYPLRGGKAMLWEGGLRVPLAVRWPGVVAPGSTSTVPVSTQDFFPTLAELAGLTPQIAGLDGVSLVPLLRQTGPIPRDALYWHYPHYHHLGYQPSGAIRAGDFKVIEWYEPSLTNGPHPIALYNVREDTGERVDLAGTMPDKARDLLDKLRAWRARVGAQEMTVNPRFDASRARWPTKDAPGES